VALGLVIAPLDRIAFLRRTAPEPAELEAFRRGLRELRYVG
jgi:hypothetical protein